jgi:HTH-type transcriptional regulator/antitoxin HigA
MKIAPIRSDEDYQNAHKRLSALIHKNDQQSLDEMDILQALIERWEREHYEFLPPTPVEAIRFRMEQGGLKFRDLEPIIGPRSRISEVLSGRRPLTIDMIRALHEHLAIPLASLVGESSEEARGEPRLTKAALDKLLTLGVMRAKESYAAFRARAFEGNPSPALLRKTRTARTNAKTDPVALEAWCGAVFLKSESQKLPKKREAPQAEFGRALARLSSSSNGPLLVKDALARVGIIFVILKHLPGTFLDGAAMYRGDGVPIIALTLRYDRIDNFWFTLLHEYCHVSHHLNGNTRMILDDLDVKSSIEIENEADRFAQEALIPPALSKRLLSPDVTTDEIVEIAAEAGVHSAIVAGRWQREHSDYRRFSKMLGRGEVGAQFCADTK